MREALPGRQLDAEARPTILPPPSNAAAVTLDDLARHRQAKPHPFRLARDKRLEQPLFDLWRWPRPRIPYLQPQRPAGIAALEVALRQLTLLESNLKRFLDLGSNGDRRRTACSLPALVNEAVERLRPKCRHTGIELQWHPPEVDGRLEGEASSPPQPPSGFCPGANKALNTSNRGKCATVD